MALARALVARGGGPTDDELTALGLTRADVVNPQDQDHGVYPENWPAFTVFASMLTQWRTSYGGIIGLDYSVLPSVMRWLAIPPADEPEVFEAVRVMESAALPELNAKK